MSNWLLGTYRKASRYVIIADKKGSRSWRPGKSLQTTASVNMSSSVHQFKVRNIDGETVSLAQYQGKVLVIVNVASR